MSAIDVSDEQMASLPSGIDICYQTFGDRNAEPLLLVMGLGGPMIWWDSVFCEQLADAGFFVIRYDNRDTGRSTRITDGPAMSRSTLLKAFAGRPVPTAYTLGDMADDAFGLFDHLGIDSAHIVGMSMGGMIVQTMALARPERVRSLTSIMSTTGRRTVGWQHPRLIPRLLKPTPRTLEEYLTTNAEFWQIIGSPGYPADLDTLRSRGQDTWDRGINPAGVLRQMIAILTQPDRTHALGSLRLPALVIHGARDKMVHVSGGRTTARAIPGAELLTIHGMGHDLPPALFSTLIKAIRGVADRAYSPANQQ